VTKCQSIEYVVSINLFRRVYDQLAAVSIVPGCLGAYRRSALDEVHAFDPHTLTEDFDTTMKVLNRGYTVRFSDAVVYLKRRIRGGTCTSNASGGTAETS